MTVIGVDPGKQGAIALVIDGTLVEVIDMPVVTHVTGSKMVIAKDNSVSREDTTKTSVSALGIFNAISRFVLLSKGSVSACVENVHEMPGQSGMFNFGRSAGYVEMAAVALGLPILYVDPTRWKRAMGCTADKDTSLARARELFPNMLAAFKRKMDDGRAEASLIGLYGHRESLPKRVPA